MKDREIVELFWKRSPQAVDALAMAYGCLLYTSPSPRD